MEFVEFTEFMLLVEFVEFMELLLMSMVRLGLKMPELLNWGDPVIGCPLFILQEVYDEFMQYSQLRLLILQLLLIELMLPVESVDPMLFTLLVQLRQLTELTELMQLVQLVELMEFIEFTDRERWHTLLQSVYPGGHRLHQVVSSLQEMVQLQVVMAEMDYREWLKRRVQGVGDWVGGRQMVRLGTVRQVLVILVIRRVRTELPWIVYLMGTLTPAGRLVMLILYIRLETEHMIAVCWIVCILALDLMTEKSIEQLVKLLYKEQGRTRTQYELLNVTVKLNDYVGLLKEYESNFPIACRGQKSALSFEKIQTSRSVIRLVHLTIPAILSPALAVTRQTWAGKNCVPVAI